MLYLGCPLRGPKSKNGQKVVREWFWPSQMTCPKSGQKVVREFFGPSQMTCPKSGQKVPKKWSKNGLSKIWGQKTAQKVVKKLSKNCFLANRGGGLRPPPQKGSRALRARARPFGSLFAKKTFFDHLFKTFWAVFCPQILLRPILDHFLVTF